MTLQQMINEYAAMLPAGEDKARAISMLNRINGYAAA